jgi:hypothetical protein
MNRKITDKRDPIGQLMRDERAAKEKEATCIRCGCTDSHACPEGCSWIWVNYDSGRGLCSQCQVDAI